MRPHRTEDGLLERISVGLGQSRDTNSKIVVHACDTIMTLASKNGCPRRSRRREEREVKEKSTNLFGNCAGGLCVEPVA